MRLFTIQPRFVYDHLCSGQPYLPEPLRAADSWLNEGGHGAVFAYEWLCAEMARRGLSRRSSSHFPVWAWRYWSGPGKARPDLRSSMLREEARDARQVLLSIDIPDGEVLLHDYEAWHYCLNYWYLGGARAVEAFERKCEAVGRCFYDEKPLQEPELHDELLSSWQTIFDVQASRAALKGRKRDQSVQATFWELRPEHVKEAVEFGMDRPRVKLPRPAPPGNQNRPPPSF